MSKISVTQAVTTRRAVRAYTDQAVSEDLVREIIQLAGNAPSGSNSQPWNVYALTGPELQDALDAPLDMARKAIR